MQGWRTLCRWGQSKNTQNRQLDFDITIIGLGYSDHHCITIGVVIGRWWDWGRSNQPSNVWVPFNSSNLGFDLHQTSVQDIATKRWRPRRISSKWYSSENISSNRYRAVLANQMTTLDSDQRANIAYTAFWLNLQKHTVFWKSPPQKKNFPLFRWNNPRAKYDLGSFCGFEKIRLRCFLVLSAV